MGLVNGIHHISMKTRSVEQYNKVVTFYQDILGLSIKREWDGGVMFDTGVGLIEIFTNGEEDLPKGTFRHIAFSVDDVDLCVKAVTEAGYEVFMGPKDIVIPSSPELHARMAFCYGPLGEEIEFFQEY